MMLLGAGAVAKKTYVDDVFSTYVYAGNGSSKAIDNGIDLAGEGGMIILKGRESSDASGAGNPAGYGWGVHDTVRGKTKNIQTQSTAAEATYPNAISSFNSNGFTMGDVTYNYSGQDFVSYSFRKAKGFFDIVTYTGNGTNGRTISHSLGCIPGMILFKRTDGQFGWYVYHRGIGETEFFRLDTADAAGSSGGLNNTAPTSTTITLGNNSFTNGDGNTYVAYVFAGGESTAATARSVEFDGSDDALLVGGSSGPNDLYGPGDFTLEAWIKPHDWSHGSYQRIYENSATGGMILSQNSNDFGFRTYGTSGNNPKVMFDRSDIPENQWSHIAVTRSGTTIKIFLNGVEKGNVTSSYSFLADGQTSIGTDIWDNDFDGEISNLRYVKGTAVYTSSFRPPTEPLTNITNTKLLCCNSSSTTGSTVTPATITTAGNPTASTDSPFDDPAAFTFGDSGDQGIIKCGSYVGTGGSSGLPEINLGFEPQWLLVKNASSGSTDWYIVDTMRGFGPHNIYEQILKANSNAAEDVGDPYAITSTGWSLYDSADDVNENGDTYIYMAIRRSDGYCGKPPELGSGCFAMDTGNSSSTIPVFDSNFPVDFALARQPAYSGNWFVYGRLIQKKYLITNTTASMATSSGALFDSNVGYSTQSTFDSGYQSWMWKRHAGFDVLVYKGDGVSGRQCSHSMNKVPEMMWVKAIDGTNSHTRDWRVFHNGLNGGSNPEQYGIKLNSTDAESQNSGYWNDTAPTSTHFTVGNSNNVNDSGLMYMTMLFCSIPGISKVGYYTGDGTTSHTITTGFTTRFLIIKKVNGTNSWFVRDSLRGLGSGNDPYLQLESSNAEGGTSTDYMDVSSTGFTIKQTFSSINASGDKYIYYAHA